VFDDTGSEVSWTAPSSGVYTFTAEGAQGGSRGGGAGLFGAGGNAPLQRPGRARPRRERDVFHARRLRRRGGGLDMVGVGGGGGGSYVSSGFTHVVETAGVNYGNGSLTISNSVPEPSTWGLMALGFAGVGFMGLRCGMLRKAMA
jgi:hypothetical protein